MTAFHLDYASLPDPTLSAAEQEAQVARNIAMRRFAEQWRNYVRTTGDTAVLEELSGPLCDDVLGQRGSALALARLEKESQLLVPLDPAHDRYRWQRL